MNADIAPFQSEDWTSTGGKDEFACFKDFCSTIIIPLIIKNKIVLVTIINSIISIILTTINITIIAIRLNCPARPKENAGCEFSCECGFTSMSERGINIHRRWVMSICLSQFANLGCFCKFKLLTILPNLIWQILILQRGQVHGAKNPKCKSETDENDPKTAKTDLSKNRSESPWDRRRVHGLTSNTKPEDHVKNLRYSSSLIYLIQLSVEPPKRVKNGRK